MASPHRLEKNGQIQVLRGAAIVLVLLEHAPLTRAVVSLLPYPIWVPGWLGVDLFFVISGYVITRSLARDRFEPLAFLVRRVFRLTPCLALLLAANAAVVLVHRATAVPGIDPAEWAADPADFWAVAASTLGGFVTLRPHPPGWNLGVVWSLAVEDQFYAALAAVCLLTVLAFRRLAPRVLPGLLFALAAGLYVFITGVRLQLLLKGYAPVMSSWVILYLIIFRFDLLALGIALGFAGPYFRRRAEGFFNGRGPFWALTWLATPLVLSAVCGPSIRLAHGLVVPVAGWGFGLLVLAAGQEKALPPARGWGYRFWAYLGDRSYGLYLFHLLAMTVARAITADLGLFALWSPVAAFAVHAAGEAILSLVVVELVYRVVERPLTDIGRRVSAHFRIIPTDAAPPQVTVLPLPGEGRRAA